MDDSRPLLELVKGADPCDSPAANSPSGPLKDYCSDPSGTACKSPGARVLTDRCEYWPIEAGEVKESPGYAPAACDFDSRKSDLLRSRKSECGSGVSSRDCELKLSLKYRKQLLRMERDLVYTPERVQRALDLFNRTKAVLIDTVTRSSMIPESRKPLVLSQLRKTTVALPPPENGTPACMNTEATGPDSGIYNETAKGRIVFCIGAIANLEYVNEYDLIHTMAHEIGHSIDPCTLEAQALMTGDSSGDPELAMKTYPGLLQCLRGGKGADGCKGAIVQCNSEKGIRDFIDERLEQNGVEAEDIPAARNQYALALKQTPDCGMGRTDPQMNALDLMDFRKDSEPVSQIGEAFADFIGAEAVGHIAREDRNHGKLNAEGQLAALTAIASDYSRIHGGCRKENTNDPHPPGFIRVNRVMMGSRPFREALGCGSVMPKEGVTCSGL